MDKKGDLRDRGWMERMVGEDYGEFLGDDDALGDQLDVWHGIFHVARYTMWSDMSSGGKCSGGQRMH